jgi:hypothetical protein
VGVVAAARAARFEVEMRRRSWGRGGRRGAGCGAKGAAAVAGVGGAGADAAAAAAAEGPKGMLAGSASPVGETGVGGGRYRPPPLGGRSAKLIVGVVGSSFVPGAGPRSLAVVGWVVQRHRRGVLLLDGRRRGTGRSEQAVSEGLGRCDLGGPPTGNSDSDSTRALGRSGHVGVDRRKLTHHLLIVVRPLGVHGLRMLPEVVEAGELLAAVAGKGTLACVLPDVPEGRTGSAIGKPGRTYIARRSGCYPLPCQVFTSGKDHSAIAVATALERLGSRWAYTTRSARGGRCRGHVRGELVHVHVDGPGAAAGRRACAWGSREWCLTWTGIGPLIKRKDQFRWHRKPLAYLSCHHLTPACHTPASVSFAVVEIPVYAQHIPRRDDAHPLDCLLPHRSSHPPLSHVASDPKWDLRLGPIVHQMESWRSP